MGNTFKCLEEVEAFIAKLQAREDQGDGLSIVDGQLVTETFHATFLIKAIRVLW